MLCCDVFLFLVKHGTPTDEDLEWISHRIGIWTRIEIGNYHEYSIEKKGYKMLLHWKERGASAATYMVLHDALCHPLVARRDLAEELSVYSDLPQYVTNLAIQ